MKPKKTPLRKCTGCMQMFDKRELIRVVATEDGAFSIDLTGKKSGRGAYICKNTDCLLKATKSKGLERSFKRAVSKEIYESLKKELELSDKPCDRPSDNPSGKSSDEQ